MLSIYVLRQCSENLIHLLGSQILVIIKANLKHWRGAARTQALNQGNGKLAVRRCLAGLDAQLTANVFGDPGLAHDLA